MIIENALDEVKKREKALSIIKRIVKEKGRNHLFDLTGLSGGFIVSDDDLSLLETYIGPAIFEEQLQVEALKHLGGEKALPVNRTSSGILATILALVKENTNVVHYIPEFPSHPSIPRSCKLVNANYFEFDKFDKFTIPDNTSLVIITGSTMNHKIIDENIFKEIIALAHEKNIPVFVDDASGARLRTIIYNQSKAIDLGADIVVTSTDKLMHGPRGGLMVGNEDLINKIKVKSHQFGLEAQPPLILAMLNGLKNFSKDNLLQGFSNKTIFSKILNEQYNVFEEGPTSVILSPKNIKKITMSDLNENDLAFAFSMILLKDYGIITIPAVSMPGASATIRFDLSTKDAFKLDLNILSKIIFSSLDNLSAIANDENKIKNIILN